jgi:SEC-C motif-containing protein
MKYSPDAPCPCRSGKKYKRCCKIYHDSKALPKNALLLMRSRYSAFALGLSRYVIETTHPNHEDGALQLDERLAAINDFCSATKFQNLQIIAFDTSDEYASVTFFAKLSNNGGDASFKEKSYFEKLEGKWYYLRGEIEDENK